MTVKFPDDLTEADHARAQDRFTDLQAARDLAGPGHRISAGSGDGDPAKVLSIGAFRLQRYVAQQRARAISPVARAAHSGGKTLQRMVGDFRMDLVDEGDLVYLILHVPAGVETPQKLHAFDEAGQAAVTLDLTEPINGAQQLVLSPATDGLALRILRDLASELMLE